MGMGWLNPFKINSSSRRKIKAVEESIKHDQSLLLIQRDFGFADSIELHRKNLKEERDQPRSDSIPQTENVISEKDEKSTDTLSLLGRRSNEALRPSKNGINRRETKAKASQETLADQIQANLDQMQKNMHELTSQLACLTDD